VVQDECQTHHQLFSNGYSKDELEAGLQNYRALSSDPMRIKKVNSVHGCAARSALLPCVIFIPFQQK
jgi:hypothetical protein